MENLPQGYKENVPPTLDDLKKTVIAKRLLEFGGNRDQVARSLGIGRATLYRYLKKFDIV